jgi:hypothetical protein
MNEACIGGDQALIPRHDLPLAIPPQLAPLLMGRPLMALPRGNNGLNPAVGQAGAPQMTIIARDPHTGAMAACGGVRAAQPARQQSCRGVLKERGCRRGSRIQVCSQRRTRAIDHNQPRRALAALSFTDLGPLFSPV